MAGPFRGRIGVERQQRREIAPTFTDHDGLADELLHRQSRLDLRRRDVLAGRIDDQVLLAARQPDIAVIVDPPEVARRHPPVGVDQYGGGLWHLEVARADAAAAYEQFSVARRADLEAGDRPTDRTDANGVGRIERGGSAVLGLAVHLGDRQPDPVEPSNEIRVDRCGGRHEQSSMIEPELAPQHASDRLVRGECCDVGRQRSRRMLRSGRIGVDGDQVIQCPSEMDRQRVEFVDDDIVELLPHPRHRHEDRRSAGLQIVGHRGEAPSKPGLSARLDDAEVAGGPLRDVAQRQVRQQSIAGTEVEERVDGIERPGDVAVGDADPLRRAGGAARVHERGEVVG